MKLAHYYSKSYTILLLDVCAAMFLIAIITLPAGMLPPGWIRAGIVLTGLYFIARAAVLFFAKREFGASITGLQTIISNFKKGRYSVEVNGDIKNDELGVIYRDLITTGNHINDIMSSQKTEINNLRELYNNIVLSISSYFLVTNDREEVIFANESFCKKFQFDIEEIIGKKIEDLFFFVTGRIKDSLRQIIETREAIVLEKTHILSKNRISVIGDVKLSSIEIKGENQILIVIDDITSKCRKDYQISLISQISETIQCDEEIDTILYTILTGVTSGSGLGFNRAALYLFSDPDQSLAGTMAVGPDTIEEAIEIWNSIQANEYRIAAPRERRDGPAAKGKRF
ncbi:MAG TPA: PAS domain-containing protein, partial [Spirochaetota bacterium]|nr:PAS domain-containing protein [Spirochaetota bacterium]